MAEADGQFTEGATAFLSFLAANPDADDVARATVHGPLRPLGAYACAVYMASSPTELALIGTYEMPDITWQRYSAISVAAPLNTCRSFRENQIVVRPAADSGAWFSAAERRTLQDAFASAAAAQPWIVTVPLAVKGLPIGVVCMHVPHAPATPSEDRQLRGVGSALALWLYLRQISEQAPHRHPVPDPSPHVRITERQLQVLALVAEGRPAREIATELRYSESTVKKDLMGLMAFLAARDRETAVARARQIGLLPETSDAAGSAG